LKTAILRHKGGIVEPDRSFERMYRRHRRAVYGSVLRDVRDPDEAEDVTQVAFLNAYRAIERGDSPERPRAWLLTIARNVVRRRARLRAGRPPEVELDPEVALALDDIEGSTAEDICAALRRLPENQQQAILLREIQGRSYAEIAAALALTVPAVEALIFRARRALAEELELLERRPVVKPERRRGLLALPLPGFAKLGSIGFSLGRAGAACLVGCAVVVSIPVGEGGASPDLPSSVQRSPSAREAAGVTVLRASPAKVVVQHPVRKLKKKSKTDGAGATQSKPATPKSDVAPSAQDSTLLGVELPAIDVSEVAVPSLPPVELPPLPAVPDVPPLPLPTS
jgi:RNA polymerase sigma-70 factor, ECF subfamily